MVELFGHHGSVWRAEWNISGTALATSAEDNTRLWQSRPHDPTQWYCVGTLSPKVDTEDDQDNEHHHPNETSADTSFTPTAEFRNVRDAMSFGNDRPRESFVSDPVVEVVDVDAT